MEFRRSELDGSARISPSETAKGITDYCSEAATNLSAFSDEEWREFLRIIVSLIVFHGDRITILGRIPLPASAAAEFQLGDVGVPKVVSAGRSSRLVDRYPNSTDS
jgi:hypothetical protein